MSISWHGSGSRHVRPAPAGGARVTSRADRPPDGWIPVDPGLGDRLATEIDRSVLSLADAAARRVSRRAFLRRVADVGIVLGLAVTGLSWGQRTAGAYAHIYSSCDPIGDPPPGPCGPSGLCDPSTCSNGNCANNNKKRPWGGSTCCSSCSGTDNCWQENCCANNNWNSHIKCCDCCNSTGSGGSCTTCGGGTAQKCICRAKVGNPC